MEMMQQKTVIMEVNVANHAYSSNMLLADDMRLEYVFVKEEMP